MPHYSFGFEKQHKASHRNTSDPGPVYDVPQSATRCGNIVRATYSFGTGPQRGQPSRSQRVPGPGHYPIPNALGPQLSSVNKSGQVVSFGVPSALGGVGRPIATTEGQHTRHGQDKSPCSPRPSTALEAHLLAQGCPLGPRGEPSPQAKMAEPPLPTAVDVLALGPFRHSPGPAKYSHDSSHGKQNLSGRRTQPVMKFPRGKRFTTKDLAGDDTPGPGHYVV